MKQEDIYKDIRAYDTPKLLRVCDRIWMMPFLNRLARKTASSLSLELMCDKDDLKGGAVFMSNHRDIVMDAAWLSFQLNERYHIRPYMGMGTNLYGRKWIEHVCKFNRYFSVFRGGTPREVLQNSEHLSGYINSLRSKGESVWIAQREGRAKDGNDQTQDAVIKMLTLYNPQKETLIEQVKRLNICPDSISYEYDPCDFLKAREMQLRRDNPEWKKSKEDDLKSMATGINGYKGKVVHRITPSINLWIEANESRLAEMKRKEQKLNFCILLNFLLIEKEKPLLLKIKE